jgi:ribosome biogenesis GTPase
MNAFEVLCPDGHVRRCEIKGKKLRQSAGAYNALAAGDRVEIEPIDARRAIIVSLVPRRSAFGRWNEKGKAEQTIVANADLVVCVTTPERPPFRPRFIDRVAIVAEASSLPLVVLLNKADLGISGEVASRVEEYSRVGYEILRCSCVSGEGLPELRARVAGHTAAFVGQSGVGKSTVINSLHPEFEYRTGELCEKHDRGRHTTTAAVLAPLADGLTWIADTPGFRRLALRGIDPRDLAAFFPELRPLVGQCALGARCDHSGERGCAFERALEEGAVHPDRYESYLRIRAELVSSKEYAPKRGRPRRIYDDYDEE